MINMKYSGINWIGQIPVTWNRIKIKNLCERIFAGGTPSTDIDEYWGGNIPWLPSGACHDVYINNADIYITEKGLNNSSTKYIPKNTTLIAMTGATCGNTGYLTFDSCANQSVTAFINDKKKLYSLYLFYALQAARNYILTFQTGGAQAGINVENCKNFVIPIMKLEEQKLIAKFLDEKVDSINKIISDLNKQIQILHKYKKQVITEIIKSGLEKNVEYIDSKKEWIGRINSQCKLIRLKNYSYLKGRIGWQGLTADEFIDEGPYCVTGTDFLNGKINWETCYHISQKRYEMDYNIHLKVGDLLITKDGTIGKLAKVDFLPDKACLNSHLLIIRPLTDDYTNEYLFYVMSSDIFKDYANILANGSTMDSLSQEKIGNFIFPSYGLNKQREIVKYLDKKCYQIDKILEEKTKQIEKMEQYKKSVIYEYVTGKKRVEGAEELYG